MNFAYELLKKAQNGHYALGAFNTSNLESIKAITNAAKKLKAPIILEASDGEVNYFGYEQLATLKKIYSKEAGIPIVLNLDHGNGFESCKKAIAAGFDYVHHDGSKLPYEENISITQEVVKLAHGHGIPVEGEMDHVEGSSADHTKESPKNYQDEKMYTNPAMAKDFCERTGIDVFASFVGNLHGIYAEPKHFRLDLLKKIRETIPDTMLSLHGGSGNTDEDLRNAVKMGIVKVNVNSEMRIAFKLTLQEVLSKTDEIAVYKIMAKPIEEIQKVVEHKIQLFGSEGKA